MASGQVALAQWSTSAKLVKAMAARAGRLQGMQNSVSNATRAFEQAAGRSAGVPDVRLRVGFSCLKNPIAGSFTSDRSAPPKAERPPATRLMTPRGAGLRLELTAIALAQARHRKAGSRSDDRVPLIAPPDSSDEPSWTAMVASSATAALRGNYVMSVRDKKLRTVVSALKQLADAHLVARPATGGWDRYRGFLLLDERGDRGHPDADPIEYRTPLSKEQTFVVPAEFFTRGWIHVLEDSEIALLLMVACGRESLPEEGAEVAIPGSVRLLQYGLPRDSYSQSYQMLERFGLLQVRRVDRHDDGRAVDYDQEGASVHRLQLLPENLACEAYPVVSEAVQWVARAHG